MPLYEVINTETGHVLGVFGARAEALRLVRALQDIDQPETERLRVLAVDDHGHRTDAS